MRIRTLLDQYKAKGKKAFIPFIMAGDHDIVSTETLILGLEKIGADIIEIGVPFSDPVADGATIIFAGMRALRNQVNLEEILSMVKRIRQNGCTIPILLFTYYNPILALSQDKFIALAAGASIDAVLVVDLPEDEGQEFFRALNVNNIGAVLLCSPTTSKARAIANADACTEFLYYIARLGTTGTQDNISSTLASEVAALKSYIDIPIAVGFGISSKEQAKEIAAIADVCVVGSYLVMEMEEADTKLAIENLLHKASVVADAIHDVIL